MKTRADKVRHNVKWFIPVIVVNIHLYMITILLEKVVDCLKKVTNGLPKLYRLNED